MSKSKPLNIKTTLGVIFLISLIVAAQANGETIKGPIKSALESGWLDIAVWGYVLGTCAIHKYLYSSNELQNNSFLYRHFGNYAEAVFGAATYGFASATSLALLKGLYLQTFYAESYFVGFANFDLVSMFFLTSFLLVYCLFNTSVMLKEVLFHQSISEVTVKN